MSKRLREPTMEENAKRCKITSDRKRPVELSSFTAAKRQKIHEYWHTKPHSREERAAYMATLFEHLLCQAPYLKQSQHKDVNCECR